MRPFHLFAFICTLYSAPYHLKAAPFKPRDVQAIQTIVHDYIKQHPECVAEALQTLQIQAQQKQAEQAKQVIENHQKTLFGSYHDQVLGNPKGSQIFVLFSDPYCGYCRSLYQNLNKVAGHHKNLKVIIKDFPIFGQSSTLAVKALRAAYLQGQYLEYLSELFKKREPQTAEQLCDLSTQVPGINQTRFRDDFYSQQFDEMIQDNQNLAEQLEINSTPSLIYQNRIVLGDLTVEQIEKILKGEF